jgi:chaperonin GroEL
MSRHAPPRQSERVDLQLRVEAAVRAGRVALEDGIVPGGGAALLGCARTLDAIEITGDEALGVKALAAALAEPMRAIVQNAGVQAEPVLARFVEQHERTALVFDVVQREWVSPWTGVVDPLVVVLTALETAVSTATTALTADVLIRRTRPPVAVNP